ncbi:MAG: hypothetical protein Q4A65_07540, partial [Bacillota bacterium]|nr:hypothetical protein [Bacillota bacterium]
ARLRAEEEARLKAEEEARALAEAKAREEARLKAEADMRAAQEAEKIKAQKEARMAIEAEERAKAEQERRKAEEERIRARLTQEQEMLTKQAENAAVEQEARKVLEQTARMREAEAAKIRAAIAGIKGEIAAAAPKEPEVPVEPAAPAAPVEPVAPAEPAAPAAPAEPAAPIKPEIPEEPPVKEETFKIEDLTATRRPVTLTDTIPPGGRPIHKVEPIIEPEPPVSVVPERVTFANTTAIQRGDVEIEKAQQATRDRITKMAKAREDFFASYEEEDKKPSTGREDMLQADNDLTKTRVIDKSAVLAGMETTRRISKAEIRAKEDKDFFESLENAASAVPVMPEPEPPVVKEPQETVEDLLSQFETANNLPVEETPEPVAEPESAFAPATEPAAEPESAFAPAPEPVAEPEPAAEPQPEIPEEGFAVKEEPAVVPDAGAFETNKPGLEDTMIMPERELQTKGFVSDFDSYGEEEAAQLRAQQEAEEAAAYQQSLTEQIPDEVPAVEETEEEVKKGGVGRVILKVILVLLIIIFALELAGIGIKFLAPQSQAAEGIDNQLNKIIHLITG